MEYKNNSINLEGKEIYDITVAPVGKTPTHSDITFNHFFSEEIKEEETENKILNYIPHEEFVKLAHKNKELFKKLPPKYKQKFLNRETFSVTIATYETIWLNH